MISQQPEGEVVGADLQELLQGGLIVRGDAPIEWLYTGVGYMPGGPASDTQVVEVVSIMRALDASRRAQLTQFARFLAGQKQRDKFE